MGEWHWNPQVDELVNCMALTDDEVSELVVVAQAYFHDPFIDPYGNPVWWRQIEYQVNRDLRQKINAFQKDHEVDMFGWQLS